MYFGKKLTSALSLVPAIGRLLSFQVPSTVPVIEVVITFYKTNLSVGIHI